MARMEGIEKHQLASAPALAPFGFIVTEVVLRAAQVERGDVGPCGVAALLPGARAHLPRFVRLHNLRGAQLVVF